MVQVLLFFVLLSTGFSQESSARLLKTEETFSFLVLVTLCSLIFYFIQQAKSGKKLWIRRIPALASVEEAVGRATEMGKACVFIPGIMDIDDIQTLAGLNILGSVARKTAEYDTDLKVPVAKSMVLSTAQDVVKEAYYRTGHPDTFNEGNIQFVTDDQFAFAASVNGTLVREKPAAIIMLGTFYAESLLIAETGNHIGAIQIAGTAETSQLPFFVASCDYVLIGEELFAASAYLSNDPMLLGSLKGQDYAKMLLIVFMLYGVFAELSIRFFGFPEFLSLIQYL
ncbi:MAG: hypothetical protein KC646_10005 [Candidatus Cloacimonetes bacterium]|nr:hypothetical protein [Candidatus Cloacimonadota bacterium]